MNHRIVVHPDAGAFLDRARPWLLEREAENNLVLGLAAALREGVPDRYEPPILFATVEEDGAVVGAAFRTPPFKLGVTDMPLEAVPALVREVAGLYDALPAVLGPEPVAPAVAAAWGELRGVAPRPGMRQRIYQLERVEPPLIPPPGGMREAAAADRDLTADWWNAFQTEAGVSIEDAGAAVDRKLARGRALFLWEDGGAAVSLAGVSGRTPHGARVGPVYTPPERRGRGYASALVAALSQRLLDEGCRVCFLYTDLANPTSNSIYASVGYQPVRDVIDVHFEREEER